MNWTQTLRGRLTLWNLAVIAVTLTLFGLLLNITNQKRLASDIDRDLMERAGRFGMGPPRQGPGGPPPRRPDDDRVDTHHLQFFNADGTPGIGPFFEEPYDPVLMERTKDSRPGFSDTIYKGIPVRVFARPAPGGGVVMTAQDVTSYRFLIQQQLMTLLIVLPMAIMVAGLGALFLTNAALKPIANVTQTASQISENSLSQRLAVKGKDELANLSSTFNAMIDRLQTAFRGLNEANTELESALENQRRFTADASHELRTPLTRLRLATSSGLSQKSDLAAMVDAMKVADQAGESMATIVRELLLLAQADAGTLQVQLQRKDLRVIAADAADSCTAPSRIAVNLPETPVTVEADPEHLKRAILNLLENSLRHTDIGKPISLTIAQAGSGATVTVRDKGEGIATEHLSRLGERFYRVDAARSRSEGGFGLGLAIAKSILEAHHGSLSFESLLGEGTTAIIRLPMA